MKVFRFVWRITRSLVWETATDNTTGLAAQMAYQLLLALPFVLLFFWHLLGLFGTDPAKLHGIFILLKSFLPPDPKVQDILDAALASVVVTGSSGFLANIGIIFGLYLGTVFIATISRALSQTHGVQEDRNWWSKYIVSFFLLPFLVRHPDPLLFQRHGLRRNSGRRGRGEFSAQDSAAGMGRCAQYSLHGPGSHRSRARSLSSYARKLSDHPAGFARRGLLRHRMDDCDQTFSVLRHEVRSL